MRAAGVNPGRLEHGDGGAGVGLGTLGNPSAPFCIERVISGQIVVGWN